MIRGEATMPLPVAIQPPSMARHLTPCRPWQGADRCDGRVPKARHLIRGEATMPLPVAIQPPS
ncbi:hypothetical protein QN379_23550, partial [Glaciimonas sp. Gout2]|uniref:hypothetical protein n=1 Tax=Glaciimonas sp. Gout2 TaxID=3048625 RepID=UPI002B231D3A